MSTEAELLANLPAGTFTVLRSGDLLRAFNAFGKLTYRSLHGRWQPVGHGYGTAEQHQRVGWTEISCPALPDPSGDLPDGTLVRVTYEGTVNGYKNGFGELTVRSAQGVSSQYLRHDEDGAAVEVLSVPTPPPSALDGKPGSLWRDPETGGIYCRTDTGRANSNEPAFSLAGGNSWVRSASWLHTVHGRATAVIARLVPAQVADHG